MRSNLCGECHHPNCGGHWSAPIPMDKAMSGEPIKFTEFRRVDRQGRDFPMQEAAK